MKLFRFGQKGIEKPGVLYEDLYLNVSDYFDDYDEYFFETGGLEELRELLNSKANTLPPIPTGARLGSPVSRPSKIVCIGPATEL